VVVLVGMKVAPEVLIWETSDGTDFWNPSGLVGIEVARLGRMSETLQRGLVDVSAEARGDCTLPRGGDPIHLRNFVPKHACCYTPPTSTLPRE
jgi:hypothetical protein